MNVKTIEAKRLPTLEEEIYGYVDEDESNKISDSEDDNKSFVSHDLRSTKQSRGLTGNLSGIFYLTKIKQIW